MDLRDAVKQYLSLGNDLFPRLKSVEGPTLTKGELHAFRVQLYILDTELRLLEQKQKESENTGLS
jgi:hypothetical protein